MLLQMLKEVFQQGRFVLTMNEYITFILENDQKAFCLEFKTNFNMTEILAF